MLKTQLNWLEVIFVFLGGAVLLFIVAPLAGIFLSTGLPVLSQTVADSEVRGSCVAVMASFTAIFVCSVGAIPLAYLLARKEFVGKRLVLGIINLPIIVPHTAAGIALLCVIGRGSVAGSAAEALGLSFMGTKLGIMVAMAFVSVPFLIDAARTGFESVPVKYEMAVRTFGASPVRVFLLSLFR